jgi:hypothetical protein
LKVAEARKIEDRVRDAMKRLARQDPAAWRALGVVDRLRQGAAEAAREIVEEADLKRLRVTRAIQTWDSNELYTNEQVAHGHDATRLDAIERTLAPINDGKNNTVSVEKEAAGIESVAMSRLVDAWDAIGPRFMGLFANRDMENAFVLEAHGTDTGNPMIKQAVKAWDEATETLRSRFNSAGGNIGKLDNWGTPHSWSRKLAVKLGQQKFVDDFFQWVDRSKYVHPDGSLFDDAEMRDFLSSAWLTITTDGANKLKPEPMPGGAVKANRGAAHRQIHFKDGTGALDAFRSYSEHNLFQSLSGHVSRMSRDIALVERWSPNSDHQFETMLQQAYSEAAVADPASLPALNKKVARIEKLYDYVAGNGAPGLDNWLAWGMRDLRAILSIALLGSAAITSISDNGTLYLTSHINKLPAMKIFMAQLRAFNPADRVEERLARRAGLMVSTMQNDVQRFAADSMGPRWSAKMSALFFRLGGLNAMTEANRRAFSSVMMDSIGALTRDVANVSDLHAMDYRMLASHGLDQATWDIWRAAQPEDWGNRSTVLTPESIYRAAGPWTDVERNRAASRLMAIVLEEQDIAVIEPGARERAGMAATQAGTAWGELARSVMLFKSFPQAMLTRHVERALTMYEGAAGKAGYLASLIALQTIFGAVAMEINDVFSGRDPRDLTKPRNMLAALLKGGALGIYGDFLFNEASSQGRSMVETLAGPAVGTLAGIDALTRGNLIQAARGEETDFGAEAVRVGRGLTPGMNLWYAKAALDHLIFQNLQEHFSPGYLARTKAKAQRDFGTTWWWAPGAPVEEARAPNVGNIVGAEQ